MFTTVLNEFNELNKKTNSAIDEARINNKKDNSTIYNRYIIRH